MDFGTFIFLIIIFSFFGQIIYLFIYVFMLETFEFMIRDEYLKKKKLRKLAREKPNVRIKTEFWVNKRWFCTIQKSGHSYIIQLFDFKKTEKIGKAKCIMILIKESEFYPIPEIEIIKFPEKDLSLFDMFAILKAIKMSEKEVLKALIRGDA